MGHQPHANEIKLAGAIFIVGKCLKETSSINPIKRTSVSLIRKRSMIAKTFLLLSLISTLTKVSFSQVRFSFGSQIGINSGGIPHSAQDTVNVVINPITDTMKRSYDPLLSPITGIWTKADINSRFFASLGIQYYWVGEKYHSTYIGHYPSPLPPRYTQDVWSNKKFHKIVFPLLFGCNFNVKKIRGFTFLGYSQIFYLSGADYVKNHDEFGSVTDTDYYNVDPFDKSQFSNPAKKWRPSITFGIGISVTPKIDVSIQATANSLKYYNELSDHRHTHNNSDFALTLKYTLIKTLQGANN